MPTVVTKQRKDSKKVLDGLVEWVTSVVETLGYGGVAFLVALENLFPPIPSEVILPLAGFLASQGKFSFPLVLMATTLGCVARARSLSKTCSSDSV